VFDVGLVVPGTDKCTHCTRVASDQSVASATNTLGNWRKEKRHTQEYTGVHDGMATLAIAAAPEEEDATQGGATASNSE
jgi:hypothetical protein